MNHDELINELNNTNDKSNEMNIELHRLATCYLYASGDDKKIIWAVLNKYVPFLSAEGIL